VERSAQNSRSTIDQPCNLLSTPTWTFQNETTQPFISHSDTLFIFHHTSTLTLVHTIPLPPPCIHPCSTTIAIVHVVIYSLINYFPTFFNATTRLYFEYDNSMVDLPTQTAPSATRAGNRSDIAAAIALPIVDSEVWLNRNILHER